MGIAVGIFLACVIEYPELECSKSLDICRVYTKKLYTPKILNDMFKISDIRGYDIGINSFRKSTWYNPKVVLKNNNFVYLGFSTATYGRAKKVVSEIIYGITNNENYTKRGNYLQSFFGLY